MPHVPTSSRLIGDYEQIRQIGSGSMGRVYLARNRHSQAVVALKVLHRKYARQREPLARFLSEARIVQQLAHPNIVSLHEANDGAGGSHPFIALEYVEGSSVASTLGQSWAPNVVLRLAAEAASALDAVHTQEIVHRDIKPSNIMIRSDGRLKLVDFGLARLLARPAAVDSRTLLRTRAGAFLGTVKYTSPECARGMQASFASDVFSLGVVLYQLATGVHPFEADNEARVLEAIRSQAPIRPRHFNSAITAALEELLMATLAKDAAARPTAAQIVECVGAAASQWRISATSRALRSQPQMVGRRAERVAILRYLGAAAAGEGSMICLSGEAGLGKTTLAESTLAAAHGFLIARGKCSERLDGAGPLGANLAGSEAYTPVLESLHELLRSEMAGPLSILLQHTAPAWHALISGKSPHSGSPGVLNEQYVTFLRAVAEDRPVALFFDDLHWSDRSTIDLVNYLCRRIGSMRLVILATYRPSDLAVARHPFAHVRSELCSHGLCHDIALGSLTPDDVDAYIGVEYPVNNFPKGFRDIIHRVTGGTPLFLAGILRDLRSRGGIEQHDGVWQLMSSVESIILQLPSTVAQVIDRRIARLSERERALLMVAAAQGMEFDLAVAAKVLGKPAAAVGDTLLDLDRFHRLVSPGRDRVLPDGTPTRTYTFVHVLYHEQIYAQMTQSERIQLSAGVAGALRSFHGERANEIAASLGFLYRTARQPLEALQFFAAAADAARHFAAHSEAAKLARLALEMLEKLPAGPERDARELSVRLLLGAALMATRSYADAEAVTNFTRAGELIGDDKDPQFFPIRLGQWATNIMSSQMLTACRLAEDLVAFAERAEPMRRNVLLSGACMAHGLTLTQIGRFVQSTRQLERAVACDAAANSAGAAMFPLHPGVGSRAQLGLNYWYLGYPDRAVAIGLEAIQEAGDDAYGRAFAQMYLAGVHQMRGEPELVVDLSSRAMAIAEKPEYRYTEVFHWSSIRRGWGIAKLGSFAEGVAQMRESLAANKSNGSKAARAHFMSLMALVLIQLDQLDEANVVIDETLATIAETSSRFYLSEALRVKGELCLRRSIHNARAVEELFLEGLAVSREPEQSCRGFELRLLMSLTKLADLTDRGQRERRIELQAALDRYEEGLGTSDLSEARKLLEPGPA